MILNDSQIADLKQQLRDYLGPVVCGALEDKTVTDIKCSDGWVWLEKHQVGEVKTEEFLPERQRRLALNIIATLLGKPLNATSSSLRGELPLTGDRVQGFVPPISEPAFYIRIHAPEVFSWEDYIAKGIMTPEQVALLRDHIQRRSNIVFSGATGSGKTTLLNTALGEIAQSNEHVTVIEDTKEIRCESPNVTRQLTTDQVSLQQLVMSALRIFPKRLVIGETRDKAGIDILNALSTGHSGGFSTVHSNNAMGVFDRFAQFYQEAGLPPNWHLMRSTIDLIVHMEKRPEGRRVTEILEVKKSEGTQVPWHTNEGISLNGFSKRQNDKTMAASFGRQPEQN